jgi:CBS-domain-containing membrane protein
MDTTVAEVMSTDLVVATRSTPYKELVRMMRERGVHALPVVDADRRVVGIVTETDLALKQEYRQGGQLPYLEGTEQRDWRRRAAATVAEQCMSDPVTVVGADTTVRGAARLLHRRGVHHLPVVDAEGRLVGIVTRRDLLGVFLRPDDEIRDRIRAGVLERLNLPEDDVEVEVSEGVATLRGKVEWRSLAREIVTLAGGVDGVVGVVDQLEHYREDTEPAPVRPSRRP